jgi:hypothetical protein
VLQPDPPTDLEAVEELVRPARLGARPLIRSRPGVWEDTAGLAEALGPAARRDLLRVLTSPSDVRADMIRQLHERPDGQEMADLLIFLEEWEWARQGMIEELSRA